MLPAPRLSGSLTLPTAGGVSVEDADLAVVPVLASRAKGDVELFEKHATFIGVGVWLSSPVLTNFGAGYGVGLGFRHDFSRVSLLLDATYSQKLINDVGFTYTY